MTFKKIRGIIETPNAYKQLSNCPGKHNLEGNNYKITIPDDDKITTITFNKPTENNLYTLVVASTNPNKNLEYILNKVKHKIGMTELNDEELNTYLLSLS